MPQATVSAILRTMAGDKAERSPMADALERQIERAISEERWTFANHFCDTLLAEEPGNLRALLLKGDLAWHRFRDAETALACYRRVLILGGFESSNEFVARARASLAQLLERLT